MARFMGQCFRLFLSLSPTPISLTRRCCVGMVLLVGTVKDAPLHSREYVLQKCVFVSADKWFFLLPLKQATNIQKLPIFSHYYRFSEVVFLWKTLLRKCSNSWLGRAPIDPKDRYYYTPHLTSPYSPIQKSQKFSSPPFEADAARWYIFGRGA